MWRKNLAVLALLALTLSAPSLIAAGQSASKAAAPPAVVNLNTATVAQLDTLPGVGVKMAERIIEYRTKNGAFKKVEDLMNVRGIGEKNFLKLKPFITVTPASGAKAGSQEK
jgi:competence protein ComEA